VSGRGSPCRLRGIADEVSAVGVARPDGGNKGLEVRVACELDIEAFQALRGTQEQFGGFPAPALVERDAASQLLCHRVSELRWRLGLDCRQQP